MSVESTSSSVPTDLRNNWRSLLWVGVLLVALGVLAVFAPFVSGIAVSILLGAFLVVGSLGHVAHAFSARGWTGSLWQIVLALVYALAGITLVANPAVGLASLTLLLIAYFAVEGLVVIALGLQMRNEPRWGWVLASGVVSLLLAVLLWAGFPSNALWAVGLLFGLNLLSTGLSLVGVAMVGRNATHWAQGGVMGE